MGTAPYYPQIPDSINTTQPIDTIVSSGVPQNGIRVNRVDSAAVDSPVISVEKVSLRSVKAEVVKTVETLTSQPVSAVRKAPRNEWNSNSNFLVVNGLSDIVGARKSQEQKALTTLHSGTQKPSEINLQQRNLRSQDWLLGIFLLLVVLFVWIRIFYSKFFATLASALGSFHISAKLFQEKNVLSHRVSFVLDFIYLVVFSVFLYQLANYKGLSSGLSGFKLYLLLLNIVILYAVIRILVLRLTGNLFLVQNLFAEYIHSTFVVNKGMGIALFPVVIMAQYLPNKLIPVVLIIGILILAMALILKSIRSYQIIIRKDVFIFYLILYLCTLEFLPLLLGYKFVTSLI